MRAKPWDSQGRPYVECSIASFTICPIKAMLVFAIHDKYIPICMVLRRPSIAESQTGGEPKAVWLRELLGDFNKLYSSVGTSLALLSCTMQSRFESHLFWYSKPLGENSSRSKHMCEVERSANSIRPGSNYNNWVKKLELNLLLTMDNLTLITLYYHIVLRSK